ncbi:MAG TPA: class F sortase [Candidatus Paceibacterota bacterium]|nr:class F sortase [Candidatus Paceibacterota bacterium]
MIRWTLNVALVVILTAAAAVFTFVFIRTFFYLPDEEIRAPPGETLEEAVDPTQHPARLVIPAIGVDADVQHVGINEAGNMATPSNFEDVGWYKYGVAPGGRGSAVIAGHVDNSLGLPGVFKRLNELKSGDDIFVESASGERQHFVIVSTRSYPYDDVPVDVVFNPQGSARLNLITCEGRWLSENRTYDQRLVVFARLANETET